MLPVSLLWLFHLPTLLINASAILSPRLLSLYKDICGQEHTCSYRSTTEEHVEKGVVPLVQCPECECSPSLTGFKPTCPDIAASFYSGCGDISILSAPPDYKVYSTHMIDMCYEGTNSTLQDLCSHLETDLLNSDSYPVQGVFDGEEYYFRNKFCALCNNVTDTRQMDLYIRDCDIEAIDVATYSNVDDLFNDLRKSKCNLLFSMGITCQKPDSISHCNVTGMWDVWNDELNTACEAFNSRFYVFKNAFCYACNTGISHFSPSIHTCTNHNDVAMEMECQHGPADPRSFPYWNPSCRRCNKIEGIYYNFNKDVNIYDESSEFPYEGSVYLYLTICKLYKNTAYEYLSLSPIIQSYCGKTPISDELVASFSSVYLKFLEKKKTAGVDMHWTELYEEYDRLGGTDTWCNSPDEALCSCDISCFLYHNCCPDMLLNNPAECREMQGRNITVITKCPDGYPDKVLQYYCERTDSDLMTVLDNTPSFDIHDAMPEFRNVFCHMCYKTSKLWQIHGYETRRFIHFKCKVYVDIENFLPYQEDLANLEQICDIEYGSASIYKTPSCNIELHSLTEDALQCRVTGNVSRMKTNVKHLCENTGPFIYSRCKRKFLNIFCEMCLLQDHESETTNITFHTGFEMHDSDQCDLPKVVQDDKGYIGPLRFALNIPLIKRRILEEEQRRNLSNECSGLEYNDKTAGICREIKCSPGRIYSNGDCLGLFLSHGPLKYFGLAAKITFKDLMFSGALNLNALTKAVIAAMFPFNIGFHLRVIRHYAVANVPCTSDKYIEPVADLEMYLYLDIVVFSYDYYNTENDFDETLVALFDLHLQYKIHIGNFKASFIMKNDWKSAKLPKPPHSLFPFLFCKYDWTDSDYPEPENTNHVFMIDKFLLCPQITLNSSEYLIKPRSNSLQLRLAKTGVYLDYTVVNSDVRVCHTEYDAIMTSSVSTTSALYHVTLFIRCVVFLSIFVY